MRRSSKSSNVKKRPCLKCNKLFRTTPEIRLCTKCTWNNRNVSESDQPAGKLYGNMGIWEKNRIF